ncbi:hypothetical protein PR202_gb15499 [Eleusine coracana subsp. coracana]|uniref:NADP-dependent oxidoreductase domain-containing protein n=1 Tax=Eleusine coracana subsp. coracana TaxID=191504 RepID=A0AAV5EXY4_ELECO|nr:hypothetical protein PR202_gb15499 [Eleusine coracana subsp. coracana]
MASTGTPSSKIPDFPAGADGWAVPAMGLGTSMYRTVTEDIVAASVLSALELGYRHFDTAALYGSERAVGEAVAEATRREIVASRKEVFVTTKVWCSQCHPELVLPSLRESLQ